MAFNVSSLNQYVNQNSKELMAAAVAGSNSFENNHIRIVEGIKAGSAQEIKIFANTLEWQAGGCDLTPSGDTAFSVRSLGTTGFKSYTTYCGQDLASRFPVLLKPGADNQLDIDEAIANNIVEQAANSVSLAIWQGQYNSVGDIGAGVSGFLKKLITTSYSGSTFKPAGTYTSFSSGTAIAIVDDLLTNMPDAMLTMPLVLSMPAKFYNCLKLALRDSQSIAFAYGAEGSADSFVYPGFDNVVCRRDTGLTGAKVIVLTNAQNLIVGTDLMSDADNLKFGHNEEKGYDYHNISLALGTEIGFPSQVGIYISA